MSRVSTVLAASPAVAFRLVEDPKSLRYLVVGARRIRSFDSRWPDPGTAIHHTVGIAPFVIRDKTEVASVDAPRRLCLDAHLRPFGRFRVEFRFLEDPEGCRLEVLENPASGLVAVPGIRRLTELGITLRNMELCRRYRRLARKRAGTIAGGGSLLA